MPEQNPADALAEIIASALKENNLISEGRVDEFREQLAAGRLKEEDWRLYAELALDEVGSE